MTDAARRGDLEAARLYLERGADLRERTIGFASPLHAACAAGHLPMAEFLRQRGAPLQVDGEMFTCIHFAAGHGYTEIVRWALDAGFPPANAVSALSAAAVNGRYDTVKLLLDHGVDAGRAQAYGDGSVTRTPADLAEAAGFRALATFIRTGAFDAARHAGEADRARDEPADMSSGEGHIDEPERRQAVRALALEKIRELSDADERDGDGVPLLVLAVLTCEPVLVQALLDRAASPNARAEFAGLTPLTQACALGQRETVLVLLERGADVDLPDGSGRTPLMHAAARGDAELVELLLTSGADRRRKDLTGRTALAQRSGPHADRIAALLKKRRP